MAYRNRESRQEREERAGEVAPAPAESVLERVNRRIAWLERELANVPAWTEELETLKRMRYAARGVLPAAASEFPPLPDGPREGKS